MHTYLKALVVAQDLAGGSSGHGRKQQRVAHAMLSDIGTQGVPVPPECRACGCWFPPGLSDRVQKLQEYSAKKLRPVPQAPHLRAVEGHAHEDESICQALAADADGAVAEVGAACGLDRVVVDVDDL
eukprot:scaffold193299_cov21-Tisochrysis_lutea.AAC.1